ncbi:MAG: thioredoxin domain-containing protein, partial [Planctomycetes bacterium]|nr:thioredoxin domain-containing protein [Planctomycetota bacterium]
MGSEPLATVQWSEFGPSAFETSNATGRPILLVLTVPWCAHCKELRETVFADPEVDRIVATRFVPIRVDAERRPDVNDRYGTGGWPTISYLTPSGDLIAQDRFLDAPTLRQRLTEIAEEFAEHREQIDSGIRELWRRKSNDRSKPSKLSPEIVEDVVDAIYERFDHRHGGWGTGSKFSHPEAIDFALVMVAKRRDQRMKEVVSLTLDKMMEGAVHDSIDGGFFRFSKTRDWRSPNFEKVLDSNAQRLRCYLEAFQLFGKDAYRQVAQGLVDWLLRFMRDPETDTFCGSQDADADYYALDAEGRRGREAPRLDRTIYTNWNSLTISSLLKASVVLQRPELREVATRALSFLLENLTDGTGTVYHYWDGTYHLPGLLSDQAYLIRALIDVSQHTGNADILLPAEAIADKAIERQKSPEGGFFDILRDQSGKGSMRRRNR